MGSLVPAQLVRLLPDRSVILSAVLFYFARPVFSWGWPLAPFIFIPFILRQQRSDSWRAKLRDALWLQFLCALTWFDWMLSSAQILWQQDPWVVRLVYAFVTPVFMLHIPLLTLIREALARLAPHALLARSVAMALLFPLSEQVFSYMYLSIADDLSRAPALASLAVVGGAPLLAFILALHMELVALSWSRGLWAGVRTSGIFLCLFGVISIAVHTTARGPDPARDGITINLIQTNGSRLEALEGLKPPHQRTYLGPRRVVELLRNASLVHPGARLTILPETIFPFDYFAQSDHKLSELRANLEREARLAGMDIIFGAVTRSEHGHLENSSIHLSVSEGHVSYKKYPKRYLMPFSESLPGASSFPWLEDIFFRPELLAGPMEPLKARVDNFEFGLLICNEIFHPYLTAQHQDVDAFIHLGNETWVTESSGPWLIYGKDVLRSIENAVPILKVSNAGLSGVFDASGRVAGLTREQTGHLQQIKVSKRPERVTVFSCYPHWPTVALGASTAFVILYLMKRRYSRGR